MLHRFLYIKILQSNAILICIYGISQNIIIIGFSLKALLFTCTYDLQPLITFPSGVLLTASDMVLHLLGEF